MIELSGMVEHIIYRNEQNGFTVLELYTEDDLVTAVGCLPLVREGERLNVRGEWREHRDYGHQIQVLDYESHRPEDEEGIERYLGSGLIKGVGPTMASRIVDEFGSEALDIIENEPERLLSVSGIGDSTLRMIVESYSEQAQMRDVMLGLTSYDITINQAVKLYRIYGDQTLRLIRENPYRMVADVSGIGFKTADKIAMSMGIAPDSPFRVAAGLSHVLDYALGEGHTCLKREHLLIYGVRQLGVGRELVESALDAQIGSRALEQHAIEGADCICLPSVYYTEWDISERLKELSRQRFVLDDLNVSDWLASLEAQEDIELEDGQREAIEQALHSGVMVITGGPGTGKTTIIKFIISLMQRLGHEVELCAPTGRAAKRMKEATGYEARTIHRLLEYGRDSLAMFGRNETCPLECDAVIVDEMSMVDVFLMRNLMCALTGGTRLIMVGDVDQLPSVGPGNVLRDIIRSKRLPVVALTRIFRQGLQSGIVHNAHLINEGQPPDLGIGGDFYFKQVDEIGDIVAQVVGLCKRAADHYPDMREVQVLSPMKKGATGVNNLNELLQQALNPPGDKAQLDVSQGVFREGDKVMQTKNDYQLEWTMRTQNGTLMQGEGVFNGDIGYITRIDHKDEKLYVLFDDDRLAAYNFSDLGDVELAYCVSVHKSQGSEFSMVILPMVSGRQSITTRNLLYTAITRAKGKICIIGRERAIADMVANNYVARRYSALYECLRSWDDGEAEEA